MRMNKTKASTDHEEIRKWAERRGAHPARVIGTGGRRRGRGRQASGKRDVGMIRLDFPGYSGEGSLEEISWEEFFDKFDQSHLALVFRNDNFNKLVDRETVARGTRSKSTARSAGPSRKTRSSRNTRSSRAKRGTRGRASAR